MASNLAFLLSLVQSYGPEPARMPGEWNIFLTATAGDIIGYLILLCGVGCLALGMIDDRRLRIRKIIPPDILTGMIPLMERGNRDEALVLCRRHPSVMADIVTAGLLQPATDADAVAQTMEECSIRSVERIGRKPAKYLWLAIFCLLLGALGTILGIMNAFYVIQMKVQPSPAEIAGGIFTATGTSSLSLLIVMIALLWYFILKSRISHCLFELRLATDRIANRIRKGSNDDA